MAAGRFRGTFTGVDLKNERERKKRPSSIDHPIKGRPDRVFTEFFYWVFSLALALCVSTSVLRNFLFFGHRAAVEVGRTVVCLNSYTHFFFIIISPRKSRKVSRMRPWHGAKNDVRRRRRRRFFKGKSRILSRSALAANELKAKKNKKTFEKHLNSVALHSHRVFTEFYRVLSSFIEFYRVFMKLFFGLTESFCESSSSLIASQLSISIL